MFKNQFSENKYDGLSSKNLGYPLILSPTLLTNENAQNESAIYSGSFYKSSSLRVTLIPWLSASIVFSLVLHALEFLALNSGYALKYDSSFPQLLGSKTMQIVHCLSP